MSRPRSELPYNNVIISAKIVLLGESTVGKSSLVLRFVKGQFVENQRPTIGSIKFLFVFFLESFLRAKNWVKVLQKYASPNIVIALAGNKADLESQRWVELDEAQTYADHNALMFMETSAKIGMNVNDIFLAIAKQLPKSDVGGVAGQEIQRVDLQTGTDKSQGSSCCSKSS